MKFFTSQTSPEKGSKDAKHTDAMPDARNLSEQQLCQLNTVAFEEWLTSLTHGLRKTAMPKSIMASLQTLQLLSDSCLVNGQKSNMTPSNVAKELLFNIFPALLSLMSDPRDSLNASVRKTLLAVYAAYQHWWTLSGGDKYSAYGQLCHEMNDQIETFLKSSNIGRHQMIEWLRIAMKSILYFPLQSFLQSLVHLLEDAHEQVRTSAKMLLAEAYHSSNRSIKETIERELRAQKTRETIVSAILDASQGTAVSLTSPTRVSKTPHLPVRDLDMEMDKFSESFKGKETEENWAQRDSSLKWIRSYFFTQDGQKGNFAKYAKPVADALAVSLMSLRTALVLCSLTVVSDLIPAVDVNSLDTISETLFPILLKLTSQTKKLVSSEASTVLQSLMFHVPHPLRLLPQIASSVVDKNVQTRQVGIVLMQIVLTQITRQKVKKDAFDKINGSTVLEKALRKGLTDSNDMVRTISRDVFYLFDDLWSSKAKKFLSELDNSVKKAVERHTRSHFLEVAAARPVKAVSRPPSAVSQSDDGVSSDVPSDLEMLTTFHNRLSPNESGEFDTPLPPSDTLLLQSLIQRVIESDNESAHLYLCESRLLSHLVSLQLIHLEDVLGPLLVVMQRTVNSAVQRCISEQMEAISESVSSEQLFNILVSNIKHPQGPRLKSSQNKRLSLANEGLLGWILELVKQGPNAEMENYKSIRGCAVKLMPIFERGTSSKQLLDLATEVFLYINRDSCDLFARVLETYDQDVSNRVYAIMQAYQDEHEDLAFTAAEMDVEPTNQTFLEIEKDDDSSNVFDETMPSGFEDNTVMAEEVSEETDLVSEAMLPEEVITPKPPSRAGRGLIGNSDDLILLNPAVARGRLSKIFKNETPAAKRPGIFEESQELPMLIDRLTSSNVSPEVIRKLIRISRSCTGDKDALIWDHNFDHLLDSIYFVLEESSSIEHRENCIIVLKELVLNQTRFFDGQEKRLSQVLLNCRAHGTNMISGSAEDALRAVMEVLDTQALMIALLELTDEWLRDPIPVTRRDSTKYQPTPAASAFQCIGKTVIKMAGDASIFLPAFLPLAVRGLNAELPEIRKATIDSLVGLHHAIQEEFWDLVGGQLTTPQRKLVDVYIQRTRTV